jgi:PAS domain S-box-containing protein
MQMNTNDLPELASAFSAASEVMLAAILDQSADCIKVISKHGTVDYMNRNGQCAMEIDDFCAVAGQSWSALWPEESRSLIEGSIEKARSGQPSRFEAFCPTAKGSPRWWDVSVSPLRRPNGELDGFIATSRDVTDRVKQGALRDAVADEMRHRLRNNYVIVGSLLRAYSKGKPEQQTFAREMIDRLNGLGVAQTMKAEGSNSCLLRDLVPALLEPYATPDCALNIEELPDVRLDQAQVDTLALVLGELAVNSTKHGALSASGSVQVSGTLADDRIELTWLERSDRKVTSRSREGGQGFALMGRVLASHAGGIELNWSEQGLDANVYLSAV